ncbi:MAG: N-acetylglutamate synthase-like GNAT family acetyltransferase [Planctomycetota bacterium]
MVRNSPQGADPASLDGLSTKSGLHRQPVSGFVPAPMPANFNAKVNPMTWTVTIGPGLPGDENKLNDHLVAAGLTAVADEIGATRFLVVKESGRIVGCGALQPAGTSALMRSLAIAPSFRGQGLGRTLVRELIDRALRQDLGSVFLLTVDHAEFFRRMGFRQTDRQNAPDQISETEYFRSPCCEHAAFMSFVFPQQRLES